jgi:hypothetical protein
MATGSAMRQNNPQSFVSTYAPRLRNYGNSLLAPVIPQANTIVPTRTTKRGTIHVNYAEDGYDDDDFESESGVRRPTGLRSLRRDESSVDKLAQIAQLGKEADRPVAVQGIWRDWMGKQRRIVCVNLVAVCLLSEQCANSLLSSLHRQVPETRRNSSRASCYLDSYPNRSRHTAFPS